jgi:polysaccharide lyase-like protein
MIKLLSLCLLLVLQIHCDRSNEVEDNDDLKCWKWNEITSPSFADGTSFGNGLIIDTAFDPEGISIVGNQIRFYVDPILPKPPENASSAYNFRSEINTAPWPINHPLGTEQWIGWEYTFGDNYVIDTTSPITIFQNHPGVRGLSPQIELEIASLDDPAPAQGGEIQVVNAASSDRIVYPVKPKAGDHLEVVIHVIYGLGQEGLLQVWLNGHLFYNKKTATVYEDQPWGGNNKWGIYHHTFNNSAEDVESSIKLGAGKVELFMGTLSLLTRTPDDPQYGVSAYDLVRPKD